LAFHKMVPEYLGRIENLLSEHLVELAESRELIHVIAPMEEDAPIQVRYLSTGIELGLTSRVRRTASSRRFA